MKFVILKTAMSDRDDYQRALPRHLEYLGDLERRGILLLSGAYEDRSGGFLLVEVPGLEDALSVARQDPLVQAGAERFVVKAWQASGSLAALAERGTPAISPVETGPVLAPPPDEDSFTVVEALDDPTYSDQVVGCIQPDLFPRDDPSRLAYLRRSQFRGLHKLILLYDDQVAGQIEFAPPEVSGLPVWGEDLTVINCLWVLEAYTGLSGGRRLLSACSEMTFARSLATLAYNDSLPWMPAGFFKAQGFSVVDQVDTGRFYENMPIVAYLLWRPLQDDAPRPEWDKDKVLAGLDFCPAYPWMYGKRLYWGKTFDYSAVLVKEGLRRPEILRQFPLLAQQRTDKWTIVKVGLPEADLRRAVNLIQTSLIDEPTYFAHVYRGEELIVVFPDRLFTTTRGSRGEREAVQYGLEKGVPREELGFQPFPT